MSRTQNSIRIDNPCPMTLARVTNSDGTFFCDSCNNTIVDFRDKTTEEIIELIGSRKMCGIFNDTQLNQPKYSMKYKLNYALLTGLAILGFNVSPIQAQTAVLDSCTYDPGFTVKTEKKEASPSTESYSKPKKRKLFRRRKKQKYRKLGCIDF